MVSEWNPSFLLLFCIRKLLLESDFWDTSWVAQANGLGPPAAQGTTQRSHNAILVGIVEYDLVSLLVLVCSCSQPHCIQRYIEQ